MKEGICMILENNLATINIKLDDTYSVNSTDNNSKYDIEHNLLKYVDRDNYYCVLSINIELSNNECKKIALIGDKYSYAEDCAILDNNILNILQNKLIIQLDINTGNILRTIKLNNSWINFGILKYKENYIIYGEIEITMLNREFEEKWRHNCPDILKDIKINDDRIHLYYFEGDYEELDYGGNKIN